jgi:hypothetical protein
MWSNVGRILTAENVGRILTAENRSVLSLCFSFSGYDGSGEEG